MATTVSQETYAQPIQTVTNIQNTDYIESGVVRELESRREENVKHFLMPDNTVQAVVYANAVHRKDADGIWQDISNDLSLKQIKGVTQYSTADERVMFAEKFTPNTQLWQLSENGYHIAMGISQLQVSADASVVPTGGVTVQNAPKRRGSAVWRSVEEARAVDNTASIIYSNVNAYTDLEYIILGNDIKENIVVKSRGSSYTYQFNLELTALNAMLNEDGSISLNDSKTGMQQYLIPAPYMYDAEGEYSDAVSYTLKRTGDGQYALTVTADSRWINASNRAFPVKIDPTVVRVDATDTYINSRYPDKNYGSAEKLWIFDGTAALFKMSLPSLPATADISSVVLNVSYFYNNSVTSGMIYAAAYQVLQPWNESTLTWNTASQNTNQGISTSLVTVDMLFGDVNAYQDSPGWAQFNITPIAESWYNGTPNYGVAIKYFDGTNSSVILNSYETGAAYRPYYVITYSEARIADGVYKLQNMGTNLYMDVRNGGYTAGTAVQLNTVTNSANMRNQLFKITFLDSQGYYNYYSIRPMTNSGMGLYAPLTGDTRNVSIQLMSYAENFSSISAERRWVISPEGSYFTIRNGSGSQGGYLASMSNAGVQMQTVSSVSSYSTWRLIPYTGDHMQGAFLTDPEPEVVVGSSINLDAVVYSTLPGVNGPATFSVCGTDGQPTTKALIEPMFGSVTASQPGTVFVVLTFEGGHYLGYKSPLGIKTATCKTVVLEVQYDHTYQIRFPDAPDRIRDHFYALRELYINEFDVWIVMTGPTVFSCYACSNCSSTSLERCTHAADTDCFDSNKRTGTEQLYEQHHTNIYNIAYRLPRPNKTINLSMYFVGHECCREGMIYNTIHYPAVNGLGSEEFGNALINQHRSVEKERMTVVHEFGHLYGVEDHYGGKYKSTDDMNSNIEPDLYSTYCIYGEKKADTDVSNNLTICDGCRQTIENNWDRYSHR